MAGEVAGEVARLNHYELDRQAESDYLCRKVDTMKNSLSMKTAKKFLQTLPLALSLLAAAACSSGSDEVPVPPQPEPPAGQPIPISLSCNVATRATDTAYENGDRIGLYVVNYTGTGAGALQNSGNHVDNMRFTCNGGWTPDTPVYWQDETTPADFYAYYPYTAGVTDVKALPFAVKTNQSTEADYKASEFLYGKRTKVSPTEAAITITTRHLMSCAVVNVAPGNGFTAESLAAAQVGVRINGLQCEATVNLADGSVSPRGTAQSISPLTDGGSYRALIVPQSVAEGNLITVTVDGRDYNLKKAFTFESAKRHTFTVTVSKTSNGINVDIEGWQDDDVDNGGTAE